MKLTRDEIENVLRKWNQAWDDHDLGGVMELFHDAIQFDNWTGGRVRGRENLRQAWSPWFENHGGFKFIEEETFIDVEAQKVLYRWLLEWPSMEIGQEGRQEKRRGVDVIHFADGKIINKFTYSKTTVEIEGKRHSLHI